MQFTGINIFLTLFFYCQFYTTLNKYWMIVRHWIEDTHMHNERGEGDFYTFFQKLHGMYHAWTE